MQSYPEMKKSLIGNAETLKLTLSEVQSWLYVQA